MRLIDSAAVMANKSDADDSQNVQTNVGLCTAWGTKLETSLALP